MYARKRGSGFRLMTVTLALLVPAGTLAPTQLAFAAAPPAKVFHRGAQEPALIGMDAYNAMMKELVGLIPDLIKDRPSGKESQRESAFKTLSAIYFAMLFGSIAMPPAGAAMGAGIGACFEGVGAAPGALIGGGIGIAASVGTVVMSTIVIVGLSFYVNEKYPPQEASSGQRGLQTVGFRPSTAGQAGPYESLIIHLVDSVFPNDAIELATKWDAKTGLKPDQRQLLRGLTPLRPQIEAIAEVKRSKRLFPGGLVAQPLSGWMEQSVKLLTADSATMEKIWLEALGAGGVKAAVHNSNLKVTMPPVLTAVGAPGNISIPVPGFSVKVGGNGGAFDPYLKTSLSSGPFSVNWGTASLVKSGPDAGLIVVKYSIGKGSTLGRASFRMKWNGPEGSLADFSPTLTSGFDGRVFFKVAGHGLQFSRVTFSDISIALNLSGGLPNNLPGVGDLLKQLRSGIESNLKNMLKGVPWAKAFDPFNTFPEKSLLKELQARASELGVQQIRSVQQLTVQAGKLAARVQATIMKAPQPDMTPREVAIALAKYRITQNRIKQEPVSGRTGIGLSGGAKIPDNRP